VLFSPGWRAPVRQDQVLAVFTLGLLLGGTLSSTVLWLLSGLAAPLPESVRTGAILAVAVLGVLRQAGWVRIPMPQNARQIPQEVLRSRIRRGALQFGFELGTGVRTFVSASAPYVLALGLPLAHQDAATTILAGTGFGAGRAVTAAVRYASRHDEWDDRRVTRMPLLAGAIGVTVLVALALLLLGPMA
jgi:F0F1-type ATP synthase membrane subunit c/vacuolar-type H+-ATPase subunit K